MANSSCKINGYRFARLIGAHDNEGVSYDDERGEYVGKSGLVLIGKYTTNNKKFVEFIFRNSSGNIMKFTTSEGSVELKDGFITAKTEHSEYTFKEAVVDEDEQKKLMVFAEISMKRKKEKK